MPAAIDPDRLALFVCGPGTGETVVVHLPGGRWLVVDSCKPTETKTPMALEILDHYGVKSLSALVLTHSHQDHYMGIPDLLDALDKVDVVAYVGLLRPTVELVPPIASIHLDDAQLCLALRGSEATLNRLRDHVREKKAQGVNLVRGAVVVPRDPRGVEAKVLWPTEAALTTFFAHANWKERLRKNANDLSGVLEIVTAEGGRWILGADLERDHSGLGWDHLPDDLRSHAGLKIPHHGSLGAIARRWSDVPPAARGQRVWLTTPYSASRLTRLDDDEGAATLLELQPSFLVSALPTAYSHPGVPSARRGSITRAGAKGPFAAIDLALPAARDRAPARNCIAGATFLRDGSCLTRFSRPGGLEIVA